MSDRKYVYLVEPPRDPALAGWQAALAGRESARANVVLIGPSTVEGFPMTSFDKTSAQVLARQLRAMYPTPGLGFVGGRGRIGVPNQNITPAIPTPLTFTGGAFDPSSYELAPTFQIGANHTCWYTNTVNQNVKLNLKPWETSFDIVHVAGPSGHATGGYYKINGGTPVTFSTYNATVIIRNTHVDVAPEVLDDFSIDGGSPTSGALIEVGCTGTGYLILSEFITYGGDENKGILVHGAGHSGYKSSDWSAGASTAGGWRAAIGNLAPSVIVIEAGLNDASSNTASVFSVALQSFITTLRAIGGPIPTCPILLVAPYDADGGLTFVDPWDYYVAEMRTIAESDPYIAFLNQGDFMPATDASVTYSLYHTDLVHGNASGRAYSMQAHLVAVALGFA